MKHGALATLLMVSSPASAQIRTKATCPDGFINLGSGCYHFSTSSVQFMDALSACQEMLPDEPGLVRLVKIDDCRELDALLQYFLLNPMTDFHFIGLTDIGAEGSWQWLDGELFSLHSPLWHYDEPGIGDQVAVLITENSPTIGVDRFDLWGGSMYKNHSYICEYTPNA